MKLTKKQIEMLRNIVRYAPIPLDRIQRLIATDLFHAGLIISCWNDPRLDSAYPVYIAYSLTPAGRIALAEVDR